MKHDSEDHLEKLIHQALAKLPELHAPETLIPRVLETILNQAQKPWWRRSWFTWPSGLRVISLAFAVTLLGGIFSGTAFLWPDVAGAVGMGAADPWLTRLSMAGEILGTLAGAVLMIWNSISKLWLLLSLAIAFLMYLSCVGIGTLCFQLAVNKR
ncbi:MAG: hypothetical protein HYY23_02505 [Verrucomicrobia bacterium]|nr:hypothetical protein [Verrucomicrobiota bacterium]